MIPRLPLPPGSRQDEAVVLRGDEVRYLRSVLRLVPGDTVLVFDDSGREWTATVERLESREARLELGPARTRETEPATRVTLLFGLTKGDAPDRVVRGATEVGVSGFLPVTSARAVRRLDAERIRSRQARWHKIAAEAVRQSGRTRTPDVMAPGSLAEALARPEVGSAACRLCFSPVAETGLVEALSPGVPSVVLAVGPEGGFTDEEEAQLGDAGFTAVRLGPRVLRAVTAGVVIPALVLQQLEA